MKDEAALLPRFLESVRPVAGEIIIVDTGSTDGSDLIAEAQGASVFAYEWDGDYAAARNVAKSYAKGTWILQLDIDEVLPEETIAAIRTLVKEQKAHAYNLQIHTELPLPAGVLVLSYPALRLFKNNKKIEYSGIAHERINASLRRLNIDIAKSEAIISHDGYQPTMPERAARNIDIFEKMLIIDPSDIWLKLHLGISYYLTKNYPLARLHLQPILSSQYSDFNAHTRSVIVSIIADIHLKEGNKSASKTAALQATSLGGNLFAEYLMAVIQIKEENYPLAMKKLLSIQANMEFAKNVRIHEGTILGSIARCCMKMNDPQRALEFAQLARKHPSYEAMVIGGFISELLKDYKQALSFYEEAVALNPESEQARFKVAVCRAAVSEMYSSEQLSS